ncbi:NTE family protein [Sphingomonas sp. NFR04]|uniref:patatin-like phospholipase family protein n=1 Tax=Sphingomonas sp. NFR04 TaxID=1566283 RepID=UPI0008E0819B|nr:patatin-like phospholipase family protein [Sphingomonas sp. NFR04]SFK47675.1 NTE family protein [Sphingomonas sp. NFR04]
MIDLGDTKVVLVLAGGNALGAYQAGVCQALHEGGIAPDWIVGTSAGAINGAILAGNAPDIALAKLAAFWRTDGLDWWQAWPETWRRTIETSATLLGGRPGLFGPLGTALLAAPTPALYDTGPLATTLESSIDFARLNGGATRYTAVAVDLESGAETAFDTKDRLIGAEHVRASAALPPAFPAVAVDDRLYVDGGLSANLPLDPVLSTPSDRPTLCIAVDLLPMRGGRPDTLGEMAARAQDLTFASQTRRTIARWQAQYATDAAYRGCSVTLAQLLYADQQQEVAGKAMDFSPASVRQRWEHGLRDAADLVRRVADGTLPIGGQGLHLQPGHSVNAP